MWIARDKDGSLWLYEDKPKMEGYMWVDCTNDKCAEIDTLNGGIFPFPEITWENSPKELIIKDEDK